MKYTLVPRKRGRMSGDSLIINTTDTENAKSWGDVLLCEKHFDTSFLFSVFIYYTDIVCDYRAVGIMSAILRIGVLVIPSSNLCSSTP